MKPSVKKRNKWMHLIHRGFASLKLLLIIIMLLSVSGCVTKKDYFDAMCIKMNYTRVTDYQRWGFSSVRIECDNVVQDGMCFFDRNVFCAKHNKWGDCVNWDDKTYFSCYPHLITEEELESLK